MALFPTVVFTKENVKSRWRERYTSEAMNKKFLGIPKGVYLGFEPAANPGDPINKLDLNLDSTESVSVLRAKSTVSQTAVDLVVENQVTLDFTGHVAFPVYVFAEVSYQVGQETTATIKTSTTAPNGIDQIGICKITAPNIGGSTLGVPHLQFDPENAPDRHAPIANTGVAFGFMTGGAEQDRQAAVITTDEVTRSRVDTTSFTHPYDGTTQFGLFDRLVADFAPSRIASGQARPIDMVQSRDYSGATALDVSPSIDDEIEVAGDFADTSRTFQGVRPYITIPGQGSETSTGAITGSTDTVRNLVVVQDPDTGQRIIDQSNGLPVFGRLTYDEDTTSFTPGTLTFSAVNTVTCSFDANAVMQAGDILEGTDGSFYRVIAIDGPGTTITLSVNFGGTPGANTTTLARRRFTVNLLTKTGGVETKHQVIREVDIEPTFGVGTRFLAGETITYNAKTGVVIRDVFEGDSTMLYRPTVTTDLILTGETIVGGTSSAEVDADTFGTLDPPDFRFFYPMFTTLDLERFSALSQLISMFQGLPREATETFAGITKFAVDGGTDPFTAFQASDSRVGFIPTSDQKDALDGASPAPTAANPYVTEDNPGVFDPTYLHANAISVSGGTVQWTGLAQSAGDFSIAAGIITFNVAGTYKIDVSINSAAGAGFTVATRRNGALIASAANTSTAAQSHAMTCINGFSPGDVLSVTVSAGTMSGSLGDNNVTILRIA